MAINAALTSPLIANDWGLPRIVRTVMEVGAPVIVVDRQTRTIVEHTNAYQAAVLKKNQSSVSQGTFLDDSAKSISACFYSHAHYGYEPHVIGEGFILVHNRSATNPLPRGFVNRGKEFWADSNNILGHNHGP